MSPFYTHVIDLWLRVFSLFLSFSTKWNARVERQFRVSDYIAKIDLYALGTTYLSAARKNHKIRFFDRRHRDPWNIIYIYISWIDVSSRTINEWFRSLASCREREKELRSSRIDKYNRKNVARLLVLIVLVIIIRCTDPEIRFPDWTGQPSYYRG